MEKFINEKGQVGVIVSAGFGAGWSTWNENQDYLCMNKTIVEMKLRKASADEVESHVKKEKGEEPYMGGWGSAEVEWVQKGTIFTINEYDGSEEIKTSSSFFTVA